MKEYIERAMAFAVLVDFPGELSPENIGLAVARKAIDALPAADVAEVRHGRWEEIRDPYGNLEGWLCECGREVKSKDNYCPNCGAPMDKEGEHETN